MRTTLSIDDDVLAAARVMAASQRKSVGQIISELSRTGLKPAIGTDAAIRNGILLLPSQPGAEPVTMEFVNRLRDELP